MARSDCLGYFWLILFFFRSVYLYHSNFFQLKDRDDSAKDDTHEEILTHSVRGVNNQLFYEQKDENPFKYSGWVQLTIHPGSQEHHSQNVNCQYSLAHRDLQRPSEAIPHEATFLLSPLILDFVHEVAAPTLGFDVAEVGDDLGERAHSFILLRGDLFVDSAIVIGVVIVKNFKEYRNKYSDQSDPTYFPNQKAAESDESERSWNTNE